MSEWSDSQKQCNSTLLTNAQAIFKTDIAYQEAVSTMFQTGCITLLNGITQIVNEDILSETIKASDPNDNGHAPALKFDLASFDESLAQEMGIKVIWMDYSGYPEYSQLHPPFEHGVSILDLIFNAGPRAKNLMKSF